MASNQGHRASSPTRARAPRIRGPRFRGPRRPGPSRHAAWLQSAWLQRAYALLGPHLIRGRTTLSQAFTSEQLLPIGVVLLILISAVASFAPPSGQAASVGGPDGDDPGPRIAIGGESGTRSSGVLSDGIEGLAGINALGDVADQGGGNDRDVSAGGESFLADGTLLKPVAVDTSVADGRGLITSHTVVDGDSLTGIASRFGVSMMTIWWANHLTSKDDLKLGQVLVIPKVDGLVVQVTEGDTIEALGQRYEIDPGDIISVNGLEDPNLIIGQTLIMPGARGDAIPEPAATPPPPSAPAPRAASRPKEATTRAPATYSGGAMRWPVVGGDNYVSQYFRYGHYGLDIAADYGSPVVAAGGGSVLFAGWKSNGGGYQVWLAHGSGIYTTYNHLSAVTVGRGQSVGRGQQVGRIGQTGWATGPHLHFEVWIGPIWDGGNRTNPLRYL